VELLVVRDLHQFEHAIGRAQVLVADYDDHAVALPDALHELLDRAFVAQIAFVARDFDPPLLQGLIDLIDDLLPFPAPRIRNKNRLLVMSDIKINKRPRFARTLYALVGVAKIEIIQFKFTGQAGAVIISKLHPRTLIPSGPPS
jgi:hypothetical protein